MRSHYSFLDIVACRLFSDVHEEVKVAVLNDPVTYPDKSTFIRIAIVKELRHIKEKEKQ